MSLIENSDLTIYEMINTYPKHKRQEDRFTEAFAFLLRYFPRLCRFVLFRIFSGHGPIENKILYEDFSRIEVSTQESLEHNGRRGRPDGKIEIGTEAIVFLENKFDSGIKYRDVGDGERISQIEFYRRALKKGGHSHGSVLLLSKNDVFLRKKVADKSDLVLCRWHQIYCYIKEYLVSLNTERREIDRFFLEIFIEYMEDLHLTHGLSDDDTDRYLDFVQKTGNTKSNVSKEVFIKIPDVIVRGDPDGFRYEWNPTFDPDRDAIRFNHDNRAIPVSKQVYREIFEDVCSCVLDEQWDSLQDNLEFLNPLTLTDVADRLDIDPSLVSRVLRNKVVLYRGGYVDPKSLLESAVTGSNGHTLSRTRVKYYIKRITENERLESPLSDRKIAAVLAVLGVELSRQTVGKLRRSMDIPEYRKRA